MTVEQALDVAIAHMRWQLEQHVPRTPTRLEAEQMETAIGHLTALRDLLTSTRELLKP